MSLVAGFDPLEWTSRRRSETGRAGGTSTRSLAEPWDEHGSSSNAEPSIASDAEPADPVDPGDEVDDVVLVDAAADLRACVHRLIPLPRLSEVRAQARIDALARRITVEPQSALRMTAAIEKLVAGNHLDGAEGVIAALGRAEAGVPVLLDLLFKATLKLRLRGAAALSLVQPREPWGDDPARRFGVAYARPPVVQADPLIVEALLEALVISAYARGSTDTYCERLLAACVGAGLDVSDGMRATIRYGDERAKLRFLATLAQSGTADRRTIDVLRSEWRSEGSRIVRRAEIAVLARSDPDFCLEGTEFVTNASQPGGLRLDVLSGLARCRPTDDIRRLEVSITELFAWCEREPTLRDDAPMDDTRNGPNVTFVDVPTRERVAAIALALDVASGGASAYIHGIATVPVDSPGR